jgi:hypothetical protein
LSEFSVGNSIGEIRRRRLQMSRRLYTASSEPRSLVRTIRATNKRSGLSAHEITSSPEFSRNGASAARIATELQRAEIFRHA